MVMLKAKFHWKGHFNRKVLRSGIKLFVVLTETGNIYAWGSTLSNSLNKIPERVQGRVVDFVTSSLNVGLLLDDGTIDVIGVVGNPVASSLPEELKDGSINVVDFAMIADGGVALDDEGNLHTQLISPARKLPEIDVPIIHSQWA